VDDLEVGPLISAKQRAVVQGYFDLVGQSGAEAVARGRIIPDAPSGGHYFAPALLAGVKSDDRLAQEEIFGPMQVVIPFDDEDQAVAIANGTPYGLVAAVWTRDGARQFRVARRLRAGQVFVNDYGAGGGVELPFGGVKLSGHGREKGFEALYGFTALKTIAVKHG
jgi:aldehyde dehydrogenase (NAD+)